MLEGHLISYIVVAVFSGCVRYVKIQKRCLIGKRNECLKLVFFTAVILPEKTTGVTNENNNGGCRSPAICQNVCCEKGQLYSCWFA